jgi:hypothetical protein
VPYGPLPLYHLAFTIQKKSSFFLMLAVLVSIMVAEARQPRNATSWQRATGAWGFAAVLLVPASMMLYIKYDMMEDGHWFMGGRL